jgi:hypothetical protein
VRRRRADAQRVAVGRRAHGTADAEAARRAADILDDDGLTERGSQRLGQDACEAIGRPARRERHDDRNRARGIDLRRGAAHRCQDRGERDGNGELSHAIPSVDLPP